MPRMRWRRRNGRARLGFFGDVQAGDYVCTPWGTIGFLETLNGDAATVLIGAGGREITVRKFLRTIEQDSVLAWLDFREGES